jgi:UDP-N-acetylglucosamine 4,6-dehydratase
MVSRLLKGGAKEIIVYSRDEYKQSEMARHLNNNKVKYWLGDVRDLETLKEASKNVDIIIHTAAFKIMDQSSHTTFDVADVNICGTRNVMLAGKNCERIVFVSTDKAFNSTCVYGASKFIAENIVLAYSNGVVWRFGNFLWSRGSVFEIFKEQRDAGIPLTITDPEATRFIIDIEDVCTYLLSNVKHGLYYPPNLNSVTIMEIAQSIAPNYPYKIVGNREGEKTHEAFSEEYTSNK